MAESKKGAWAAITNVVRKAKDLVVSAGKTMVAGVTHLKDFISHGVNFVKDKWTGNDYDPVYDRTKPPMDVEYG